MSLPKVVLISGTNRGIGKALLQRYLAKPNHIVIGANRDPSADSSKSLYDLPTANGTKLIVVKLDATVEPDALRAVKELQESHGIEHIDTVIANAGIASIFPSVAEVKIDDMLAHVRANVFGVVLLYQATLPLLLKAKSPTWATMGSGAGVFLVSLLLPFTHTGEELELTCPVHSMNMSPARCTHPPEPE